MAHSALRVLHSLHDTPLLISQASLSSIVSYLESRNEGNMNVEAHASQEPQPIAYNPETKVGMLSIEGALTYKPTGMEMLCGGTSYTSLLEQAEEMIEAGAKTIVQYVNSGGGQAYGMSETAQAIRKLADENGVKIVSYVDGVSASAGYGLIVNSDEIIVNPEAEVGSVGVVVKLQNVNEHLKKEGIHTSFVYAGDSKIPYAEDGSFRKEFIADLQTKVDALYESFTAHVAAGRNMKQSDVKATQAKMFMANEAIELGLADKAMTRSEFALYLANDVNERKLPHMFEKLLGKAKAEDTSAVVAELNEQLEQMNAQFVEMQEQFALAKQSLEAHVSDAVARAEAAEAALQAQKDAQEAAIKAQAEAKEKSRMDALKEAVGDVEAEAAFADIKELSDEAFSRTVARMAAAVDKTNEVLGDKGFTVEQSAPETEVVPFSKYLNTIKK